MCSTKFLITEKASTISAGTRFLGSDLFSLAVEQVLPVLY